MSKKISVNIGFEKQLGDVSRILWGHVQPTEYRNIIIGIIFLRYASEIFDRHYKKLIEEGKDIENSRDSFAKENIFFIPKDAHWDFITSFAHTSEIGQVIDSSMEKIENENKELKDLLPKDYAKLKLDKKILGDIIDIFTNNIDMSEIEENEDILGRSYEYLIEQFAKQEGGVGGGEFYTPPCIVKILVSILHLFNNCSVYDCCCGSGGMFVQSDKFIKSAFGKSNSISVYGQESNMETLKMAKINMAIRGIKGDLGLYNASTLTNDLHKLLKADFILANPPFNYHPWGREELLNDVRWKYGIPPANNANYAWIEHMIYHLAPNGKIGLVLSNGALSSKSGGEGNIRKNIIEEDLIEGIISLPDKLFYATGVSVSLWFITKNKKQKGKTLFIDARDMGYLIDRTHKDIKEEDINKIIHTFESFQDGTLNNIKGFCYIASLEEIKKQNFILTPSRYVGIKELEEDNESFDEKMKSFTSELSIIFDKSHKLEENIKKTLGEIGYDF